MKSMNLPKMTLILALLMLMATCLYAAPRDVDDLVGSSASRGESELKDRGYHYRKTIYASHSTIAYWWNSRKQVCIAVTTADGRFKSIMDQPDAVCEEKDGDSDRHYGDRDSDRHHGDRDHGRTPHVMRVDNGNVAVDVGGCNVLFNRHGDIVNQGDSCSRADVREARDAFESYQREQGGSSGSEAPPGGFGGQDDGGTLTCESKHNKYQFCRWSIGSHAEVRIKRRLSDARCKEGESWGYEADGVWVDKGCSAVFEIR